MPDSPLPTRSNPRREAFGSGVPPARYKLLSPARLPITRAPVVASQHSPDALLESPVLLTQVKAEPSPTTGTFFMPISSRSNPSSCAESSPTTRNLLETSILKCGSRSCSDSAKRDAASVSPEEQQHKQPTQQENLSPHDLTLSISPSSMSNAQLQAENRKPQDTTAIEGLSDDGYMWRKCGQKLVKGSELPRSYYECAHPSCQVKKQLECSRDGKITDVVYKGSHDHPKPQTGGHQPAVDAVLPNQEEERIVPPFPNTEDVPCQVSCVNDRGASSGQSAVPARNDGVEILAATGNINGNNVQSDDDPGAKRRRGDAVALDDSPVGKAVREPRVVVQTLSEIDVLDDGYRWRKYGQKVVKGNPNPRSYYKCTNIGCGVRKHVERASHDPKAVITTYEGKHNHDVPTLRSASHEMGASMASCNGNDQFGQVPAFLGAPRMYDATRGLPLQFHQPGASEIVSLDLEVGLSPRYNGRDDNMLQTPLRRQIPHFSIHMGGSNRNIPVLRATTVPPFYEGLSARLDSYMPRDAGGGSMSFDVASTSHSCSSYKASIGSLLAGP